jgi:inhibitor of KinA sporulation pathway (predicted exonuclease)
MSDVYVVIHIATTCDEQGVYVSKDSAETIEIAWELLDATDLHEVSRDSVLIRPVNTPITALCTSLTTLTWEHVRNAGTFKDAVNKIDQFVQSQIVSKGLEFTFVTLNSWDLRVQLPREARDKSVVLPAYLQHAKLFDLKQEYSKWQAHHPEILSYSPSNLANIITALEVDINDINVPFQLNSLQQTPRSASDEVVILSKILTALVKKAEPVDDHPDVLSRPFDARADVRAFLAERSKVLHLSNLPNDTTQSELESWFTQYGGRPIAFWTLKTPDQQKSIGLGFAVFSSHEEAAESLAMNGRSLNDKCVEVQPSSARVLDRAQEILTPFPPSKNRPRPGDWTCPSCGFSNFQRRTACFRCSFPAASAAAIQESMHSPREGAANVSVNANTGASANSAGNSNNIVNNNNNNNNANTNNNSANFTLNNNAVNQQQQYQSHQNQNQNQHQTQNQSQNQNQNQNQNQHQHHHQQQPSLPPQQQQLQQHLPQQQQQQPQQNHSNNNHTNHNNHPNNNGNNNNGGGNNRSSVPFRAGDWKCGNDGCSYHNFAKNICCLRCGAPRINNVVSSNQSQPQPHQHQSHLGQQQSQGGAHNQISGQQQQLYGSQYGSGGNNNITSANALNNMSNSGRELGINDLSSKIGGIVINGGN